MPLYQIEVKILHIPLLHKQRANEKQNWRALDNDNESLVEP